MIIARPWQLFGLALAAASTFAPRTSSACSADACEAPQTADVTRPLPANVQSLPLHPGRRYDRPVVVDAADAGIVLVDPAGDALPLTITADPLVEDGLLLGVELQPDTTYRLRFRDSCVFDEEVTDAGIIGAREHFAMEASDAGYIEVPFVTHATHPPPASAGTLRSSTPERRVVNAESGCGTCTRKVAASAVTLTFSPSAELVPFLPVTVFELVVDGATWTRSRYGEVGDDGGLAPRTPYLGWRRLVPERRIDELFSSCGPVAPAPEDRGVTPGAHTVSLRAVVPGVADLSTPAVEVVLDCGGWASAGDEGMCGAWNPRSDGLDAGGAAAGGSDGGAQPDSPAPVGCSGCSVVEGPLVIGLFLILALRRRRSRRF